MGLQEESIRVVAFTPHAETDGLRAVASGGPESGLEDWIAEQEARARGSYTITEPALGGTALQTTSLKPEFFRQQGFGKRQGGMLAYILESAGVFSAADALSMGEEEIVRAANFAAPGEQGQGFHMGPWRIGALRQSLLSLGWNLPRGRATMGELTDYYQDVRAASPAILLPHGPYNAYPELPFTPHRFTVGHFLRPEYTDPLLERIGPQAASDLVGLISQKAVAMVQDFDTAALLRRAED